MPCLTLFKLTISLEADVTIIHYHRCHLCGISSPGVATVISLPLNMWIISLEDNTTSFELRLKLCSVHFVVGFIIIYDIRYDTYMIIMIFDIIYDYNDNSCHDCGRHQVRVTVEVMCVCSYFITDCFRFFLVLHADGLVRKDKKLFLLRHQTESALALTLLMWSW